MTFAFRLILAFKVFDEVYLLTGGGPGHGDRGGELHALPALLHARTAPATASAMSIAVIFLVSLLLVIALSARRARGGRRMSGRHRRLAAGSPCTRHARARRRRRRRAGALGRGGRLPDPDLAADGRVLLHAGAAATSPRSCFPRPRTSCSTSATPSSSASSAPRSCLAVATLAAWSLHRMRWPRWVPHIFLGWALVFHMIPPIALAGAWFTMMRARSASTTPSPGSSSRTRRSTCRWRSG